MVDGSAEGLFDEDMMSGGVAENIHENGEVGHVGRRNHYDVTQPTIQHLYVPGEYLPTHQSLASWIDFRERERERERKRPGGASQRMRRDEGQTGGRVDEDRRRR